MFKYPKIHNNPPLKKILNKILNIKLQNFQSIKEKFIEKPKFYINKWILSYFFCQFDEITLLSIIQILVIKYYHYWLTLIFLPPTFHYNYFYFLFLN